MMLKYRTEIDGLRAIAVIPVLFYHAGIRYFEGGFIGVDIFFVISGFLITTILIKDINNNKFSVIDFYERRIRRIFPVLFFICLMTVPFSFALMSAEQFKEYSLSLISVVFFVSNFIFWLESGYFANAADLKPLLHTWSLSVEEQFYVFFPFLLFCIKDNKSRMFWLSLIFICSLIFAEYGWRNAAEMNFYLIFSRAWELMLGGIASILMLRHEKLFRLEALPWLRETLTLSALATLILSIVLFTDQYPHPSLITVFPCAATAILLLCARRNTFVGRLLSIKFLVFTGLLSYSLYLWHQPILVFLRLMGIEPAAPIVFCGFLILSYILSYFSWRFIETPFRKRRDGMFTRRGISVFALVMSSVLFVIGTAGYMSNLKQAGMSEAGKAFLAQTKGKRTATRKLYRLECDFYLHNNIEAGCFASSDSILPETLIWGDSHATGIALGLTELYSSKTVFSQVTTSSCRPNIITTDPKLLPKYPEDGRAAKAACEKANAVVTDYIAKHDVETVVIQIRGIYKISNWDQIITFLGNNGVKRLVILGPLPQWDPNLPEAYASVIDKRNLKGIENYQVDRVFEDQAYVDKIETANSKLEVIKLSHIGHLCDKNKVCQVKVPGAPETDFLMSYDYGHPSRFASIYHARVLFADIF